VKKVFIGLKGTDSGIINLVLIFLGLAGVFCTFSVLLGVFSIHQSAITLNTDKFISTERINIIKQNIAQTKTNNIITLIVGYISLIFDYIIYKIIQKKNKQEHERTKNHWDINKLN
jgi:uncharacterized membrane protein YuzA (DUF378 family)